MSKRIPKKLQNKNLVYNINYRLRKSSERLKKDFKIERPFQIKTPNEFKSQKELNSYLKRAKKESKIRSQYKKFKNNTKITPTSYINKYGVEIPKKIEKEIKQNIKKANILREKFKRDIGKLEFTSRKKPTGSSVYQRQLIGVDKRYQYFNRLTYNRNTILNKEALKMKRNLTKKYTTKKYYEDKQILFKQNYIKSLKNTFGNDANDIINQIKNMEVNEFIKIFYTEDAADINFIYSFESYVFKLTTLKSIWGM